jgi:D-methionine transport system ATP-binding protein
MTDLSELAPLSDDGLAKASAADAVIRFEQIGHRFHSLRGEVHALSGIDFSIARGEIFGIIGRSGAGKSTLVRTINLLEKPTSGRVLVNGIDLAGLGECELAYARRRIGMVFQHFNLLSSRTVAQNIGLPLRIAGVSAARIAERVDTLLELVGLAGKRDVYPAQLSGGQKQRVGIARALAHDPDILLCDEATSALDPETTESILQLLRDINGRLGLSVVLITHEMAVIRAACDRVAVLEAGRLVELGEVWQVFGAPEAEATRALLRSVVHDLPRDLASRVSPARHTADDALLLEVTVDGASGQPPDLVELLSALAQPQARVVHAAVERIQGRTQGRLVFAVPGGSDRAGESLGWAGHRVRTLGYLNQGALHA